MATRFWIYTKYVLLVLVSLLMLTILLAVSSRPAQAGWDAAAPSPEGVKPPLPEQSASALVESISAGGLHTCGLRNDGTIVCWGLNTDGQSTPPVRTSFTQVSAGFYNTCGLKSDGTLACWGSNGNDQSTPPAGTFTQVSVSDFHACGLKSDGTLACWGSNGYGQSTPPAGTFTQVNAGNYHSCGLKSDGTLACWGDNSDGQASPPAGTFTQVSAGLRHTCGLKSDGTIVCWGDNTYGQATPPIEVTFNQVSVGDYHACGLKSDGTLVCWGWIYYGQSTPPAGTFTQVSAGGLHTCGLKSNGTLACWGYDSYDQSKPPAGALFLRLQISAGGVHTCALQSDGTLACWGRNDDGESTPPAGTFTQISAGSNHSCGLKSNGTLACWGLNNDGQSSPPSGIFTQISTGGSHTCGLKSNGTLACWGDNTFGQSIPPAGTFTQVSVGIFHNCGLKNDGTLICWGANGWGQSTPPSGTFSQISAGFFHTCGLKSNGTLACWGRNDDGESTPPTGTFSQISAGSLHTCGLKSDGSLACWGDDTYGQATPPTGIFNQISAGVFHTCGLKNDSTLTCWGYNTDGQAFPFTISGNVGVSGATLSYTDGSTKTTTSASDGSYSLYVSYKWSGTVTPSITGHTFSPASLSYNNVLSNLTDQNYIFNNQAPSANADADQSVNTMDSVSLNGSGSNDPDGDTPITYQWNQIEGPPVTLNSQTIANPTFTAPSDPTNLIFSLVVTDSLGLPSGPDDVIVTVNNQAPIADAGQNQSVDTLSLVSLDGNSSNDPDSDTPISYLWNQIEGPPVTLNSQTTANPTFTAPSDPTTLIFSLVVTDSLGLESSPDEVIIVVNNQEPIAKAGQNQSVDSLALVALDGSGSSDPDGDTPLTYQWSQIEGPPVTLNSQTIANPTFTAPYDSTTLIFSLVVTDSLGLESAPDEVIINIGNQAPVADAGSDQNAHTNSLVMLDGNQSYDPDDNLPLTFQWTQIGGSNVILDNQTSYNPTFTTPSGPAILTFSLTVTDSLGLASEPDEVVITVQKYYLYLPLILR